MGYDFTAKNKAAGDFHLGASSFPVLLEACGYLFSSIHHGGQWYCAFCADARMGKEYPMILSNDGFKVTAGEAKIMARMARNYVAIQRTLPEENMSEGIAGTKGKEGFRREDLERTLIAVMNDVRPDEKWPRKIRADFVDKFEKFAEWAENSGGFEIW
jgi:hypothetical protein